MSRILNPSDLVPGQSYWLKSKQFDDGWFAAKLKGGDLAAPYFGDHVWASDNNPQAFTKWEIRGPIPKPVESNYDGMPHLSPENLDNAKAQILSAISEYEGGPCKLTQWESSGKRHLERALEIIEECQTVETE